MILSILLINFHFEILIQIRELNHFQIWVNIEVILYKQTLNYFYKFLLCIQFDLLCNALYQKCCYLAVKARPQERVAYRIQHDNAIRKFQLFRQAQHYYYDYFVEADQSGIKQAAPALVVKLHKLQVSYQETSSNRLGYFFYLLAIEYYLSISDFARSIRTSEALLQLIADNSHMFMPTLRGIVLKDLAINVQSLFDFGGSLDYARQARVYFKYVSANLNFASEVEATALFHLNRFDEALDVLTTLVAATDPEADAFFYSTRSYLQAYTLFALGRHREAYRALLNTREIERDREGWNIGIRLLTILTQLTQERHQTAEAHLESLRKYIQRLGDDTPLRPRDRIVFKLLRALEKSAYNYPAVAQQYSAEFQQLASTEKGLRWEPGTHELIPFPQWFAAQQHGEALRFSVPAGLYEWANAEREAVAFEVLPEEEEGKEL